MGMTPTPTAILKLRGSRRARAREKRGEPMPEHGAPQRPRNVTNEARELWTAVTRMLDNMGVLTTVDGGQLERYCLMFVQWRQMQRVIGKLNTTDELLIASLRNDELRSVLRNAWAEAHRLDAALKQVEMQFGLTPAARARLACLVHGDRGSVNGDDREALFFGAVS